MKTFIFICIFGDSRKSKKSYIWLVCLHSDMLSIWQNSMQAFAKNNQTLELAYDTLQFNTKIIRIAWQNFKILTLSVQSSLQPEGIGKNL